MVKVKPVDRMNKGTGVKRMKKEKQVCIGRIRKIWIHRMVSLGLLIPIMLVGIKMPVYGKENETEISDNYDNIRKAEQLLAVLDGIFQWKKEQEGIGRDEPLLSGNVLEYAGSSDLDWYVFAMAGCGCSDNYEAYAEALKEQIVEKYKTEDKLDANSATEWHRQILVLLALGENPEAVTDENTAVINLVADGTYNRGQTRSLGEQGINGYIFALLALDSMDYSVPEDASDTRESMLAALLDGQNADGGFALAEGMSDVDITAMALQALAPYCGDATVEEAVNRALQYLSECQMENGAVGNNEEAASESTAQVITALCCLGIDADTDSRFVKNGNSLLDAILLFRNADGGFSHLLTEDDRVSGSLSGQQTACALLSYVKYCVGESSIYDFTGNGDGKRKQLQENPLLTEYRELQKEIDEINGIIQTKLYPFEQTDKEGRMLAKELMERLEDMPEAAKTQILAYDKLCEAADAEKHPTSCVAAALAVVMAAAVLAGYLYHRKEKTAGEEQDKNE